jgi:regulation of enolase protein 1 (concanavalin A-like superfamily)
MRLPGLIFLLFLAETAFGQVLVEGTVYDAETGEAVIGAHIIGIGKQSVGTSTNGEGAFVLHAPAAPDSIRISCIGYQTFVLRNLVPGQSMDIRLKAHVISLEALTIQPPQPQQLIREAVAALSRNNTAPPLQLRGFYREIIRKEKTYYSVAEAVFESQLPRRGDDEAMLKLVQGRRSESVTATRIFEDYHPGGGPNYLVNHLLEAQVPPFLRSEEFDDYTYTIDSISSYEGRDVYLIGFDQRDGLKKNLWKGTIFIEAETLAIIQLRYSLSEKGIEYRKHLSTADNLMANLLGIDYTVLRRTNRYSYRQEYGRWRLHEASLEMDIHFQQPRKGIDETFTLQAQLLSLGQKTGPLVPFDKEEVWRKNRLVKNLPGEFDEQFWGSDNILRPESSLTAAVARMDVLRAETLPTGVPDGWNLLHAPQAKVYKKGDAFLIKPYVTSRWKDEETGPFLWKPVTGDFEWTARVRVTRAQDTTTAPQAGFQLGGLMIRRGDGDTENQILYGVGCMGNPQMKRVSQQTIRNKSATQVTKVEANEFQLRIRRRGNQVELQYRTDGTEWIVDKKYTLTDWPAEIQCGIAGYAYVPGSGPKRNPDLLIRADRMVLTPLKP